MDKEKRVYRLVLTGGRLEARFFGADGRENRSRRSFIVEIISVAVYETWCVHIRRMLVLFIVFGPLFRRVVDKY